MNRHCLIYPSPLWKFHHLITKALSLIIIMMVSVIIIIIVANIIKYYQWLIFVRRYWKNRNRSNINSIDVIIIKYSLHENNLRKRITVKCFIPKLYLFQKCFYWQSSEIIIFKYVNDWKLFPLTWEPLINTHLIDTAWPILCLYDRLMGISTRAFIEQ